MFCPLWLRPNEVQVAVLVAAVLPQSRGVFVSPRPPRLKTRGQGRRLALARPRYAGAGYGYRHTSPTQPLDRKSTRLNSSHANISYAVFCLKKKIEFGHSIEFT